MSTEQSGRGIAVFDFDDTLAAGDSLLPFLQAVMGRGRWFIPLFSSLAVYMTAPAGKGRRTAMKESLLRQCLAGRSVQSLAPAIARMKEWPRWLDTLDALKDHHARGHHILIASGSLDLYMPTMLEGVPYDGLLCTRMEVKDGLLTGEMASGNCVRERKAELVAAYLREHGPFTESWGYGNAPHDLPMMALMAHRKVV